MAFNLDHVFNNYLHMTYRQKVDEARKCMGEMGNFLLEVGIKDDDRVNFYLNLVRLFVNADGKASLQECQLFNDVFMISLEYPKFTKLMQGHDDEFIEAMDSLIDKMDEKAKVAACSFGLVFLSVDRDISDKERAVFERILA